MCQYFPRQGYRGCSQGNLHNMPNMTNANYIGWQQGSSYITCFVTCIHKDMLDYVHDPKTLKKAHENLKNIFVRNMTSYKHEVQQELDNIQQKGVLNNDYILKIMLVCDFVASINMHVNMKRQWTFARMASDNNLVHREQLS